MKIKQDKVIKALSTQSAHYECCSSLLNKHIENWDEWKVSLSLFC